MFVVRNVFKRGPFGSGTNNWIKCYSLTSERATQTPRVGLSTNVGIVGAPINKGQRLLGVEKGPQAIRDGGLVERLQDLGINVIDYGDVTVEDGPDDEPNQRLRNPRSVGSALDKVSKTIDKVYSDGRMCLLLGGDHSVGMSSIHSFCKAFPERSCHVWVDAHADINTAATTNSGNIHGMPVSIVLKELKEYNQNIPGFDWLKPCINAGEIAFIGLRDVEPLELSILNQLRIKYFSMQDVDRLGIPRIIERVLDVINPRGNKMVHVSFDIDVIDSIMVPSTGTPVDYGLTRREALLIAEELSATGLLKGLDLVEVNPLLGNPDDVKKTVSMAVDVISTFLSRNRPGLSIYENAILNKP